MGRPELPYRRAPYVPSLFTSQPHRFPTIPSTVFQAHKFFDTAPRLAEAIRRLPSPRAALAEAGRNRDHQRADWFEANILVMDAVLRAKFTQHRALRALLLDTGDAELIEDSPVRASSACMRPTVLMGCEWQVDAFWGWGSDGMGRNELGRALMRLRDKLRAKKR